jgi:hypothetical protein
MDNTAWGYYADGFFDRRPIENARGGNARPSSAVAVTGNGVAYLGRLFFNPLPASERYNASLFFPATGYRNPENGSLTGAGSYGMYWSATTMATSISPDNSASGMRLDIGYTQLSPLLKTSGVAVRPVK